MGWYRAPELFYGAKYYGVSVDIWSLGCVCAELLCRKPFFQGRTDMDMLVKIFEKRGTPSEELWPGVSSLPQFLGFSHSSATAFSTLLPNASVSAHGFLDKVLWLDPKGRPKAAEALLHEFFASPLLAPCAPQELPFVVLAGAGG